MDQMSLEIEQQGCKWTQLRFEHKNTQFLSTKKSYVLGGTNSIK